MKGEVWMDGRLCGGVRRRQRRSNTSTCGKPSNHQGNNKSNPKRFRQASPSRKEVAPARWLPKSARVKLDVCKFVGEHSEPSPLPEGEGAISQKLQGPSERCFGNWFRQAAVSVLVTMKLWKRRKEKC